MTTVQKFDAMTFFQKLIAGMTSLLILIVLTWGGVMYANIKSLEQSVNAASVDRAKIEAKANSVDELKQDVREIRKRLEEIAEKIK